MKDTLKPCLHSLSEDAVYKEVVIIGNGPSGIVTSLLLAGWSPHLKPIPDDLPLDPMLRARLAPHAGAQLLGLPLAELAEGLEGRSQNPLPLLMDNLLNPCADLGLFADPLVDWTYDADKQISHVVLGRGPAGGSWHAFPPRVLTLSPGGWLALPGDAGPGRRPERAPAARVAGYYCGYVARRGLQRYFRSGVVVTGLAPCCDRECGEPACPLGARWLVTGYERNSGRPVRYACRYAVLACGADKANVLGVPARGALYRVPTTAMFDQAIGDEPILVVGSGLSAADCVLAARGAGRRVAHAYRTRASALDNLPLPVYPDYREVHRMMREGKSVNHTDYIPLPDNAVIEITPLHTTNSPQEETTAKKRVKLLDLSTDQVTEIVFSMVIILIGSRPDLNFIPPNFDTNYERQVCQNCTKNANSKMERQCFFRDRWHYIKSMVGQGIRSCKTRYWDLLNYSEINGNLEDGCIQPDCKRRLEENKSELLKTEFDRCECIDDNNYNGLGLGIDPKKPIHCRTNPILIDKGTHEVMNAPKGLYALGPLTSDNFVRFISGGAVAAVAHMRLDRKERMTDLNPE